MDAERWHRMEMVFDAALELPESERGAYVREACGDDQQLLDDVLGMLDAAGKSDQFLEQSSPTHLQDALRDMASRVDEPKNVEEAPTRVGPYRLIKPLGRGGMGEVYLAVRDDEAYRHYVAVKVIKRGMDTDEILQRFRVERQILASLTHPNIARLLDGGSTEDGLSYFVMEYIEGQRIDTYCDEHRLPLMGRLDLFERVCNAVHYAHQNLVVHRDLKPANILVTASGEVKLLDFGIAKFMGSDLMDMTVPETRADVRVMTPEYASPEQVRGGLLTTASDVYQLGVLLYELLTGHRPFTFETKARHEIEKIVLESEPERPSTAISRTSTDATIATSAAAAEISRKRGTPLERLRRELSGDLDRIVLMALRKEQDRRYQSADQLLQDIQRFRKGLPVSAQSDSFGYRAGKFVRRNRAGVAAGVAIVLLLVVATLGSIKYAADTTAQKEQIELEAEKLRSVTDFVVGLFEEARPDRRQGRDMTVRELVDAGARSLTDDIGATPELRAALRNTIGAVYTEIGEYDTAVELLENNLGELRERLGDEADDPELAQALYRLAYVVDEGATARDWERSVELYREAYAMQRRLWGPADRRAAQTLNDMAIPHMRLREDSTARVLLNQALAERRQLLGPEHGDIAETLSNLGTLEANAGDFEASERYYRQSLDMSRATLGDGHPLVADNIYNLGTVLYDLGAFDEARSLLEDAVARRETIYGPDHDETARALSYLGRTLLAQGNVVDADRYLTRTYDIHRSGGRDVSFITGMNLMWLARLEQARGDVPAAIDRYVQSVDALSNAGSDDYAALFQDRAADLIAESGDATRAIEAYHKAAEMMEEAWGPEDVDLAAVRLKLGRLLVDEGQSAAARTELSRSLDAFLAADMAGEAADVRRALARLE